MVKHSRGFSLAEVLLTIFLLAVPLLAAVGAQIFSFKAAYKTQSRQTAKLIAASLLEESERELSGGFLTGTLNRERQAVDDFPEYEYEMTSTSTDLGLYDVQVSVFWEDSQGPQELKMRTKLLRR